MVWAYGWRGQVVWADEKRGVDGGIGEQEGPCELEADCRIEIGVRGVRCGG